jgi:hypothetical protein
VYGFKKMMAENSSLSSFLNQTDFITLEIANSSDPRLTRSKLLLERVTKRDFYKQVLSFPVSPGRPTQDIINALYAHLDVAGDRDINRETVVIKELKFNYGFGAENPLENMCVFDKNAENHAFKVNREQISLMLPSIFEEVFIRVYSRNTEQLVVDKIKELVRVWSVSRAGLRILNGA